MSRGMIRTGSIATGLLLPAALLQPAGAGAQGRGAPGAESRATVRISVSVAPRLEIAQGGAAAVAANAPALRYRLVVPPDPARAVGADRAGAERSRLLLIVPE